MVSSRDPLKKVVGDLQLRDQKGHKLMDFISGEGFIDPKYESNWIISPRLGSEKKILPGKTNMSPQKRFC